MNFKPPKGISCFVTIRNVIHIRPKGDPKKDGPNHKQDQVGDNVRNDVCYNICDHVLVMPVSRRLKKGQAVGDFKEFFKEMCNVGSFQHPSSQILIKLWTRVSISCMPKTSHTRARSGDGFTVAHRTTSWSWTNKWTNPVFALTIPCRGCCGRMELSWILAYGTSIALVNLPDRNSER